MSAGTGVIMIGHGRYAEGMFSPLNMLAGIPENFAGVEYPVGMSEEALEEAVLSEIGRMQNCPSILLLTDVEGGTPFKISVKIAFENERVTAATGTNLAVLLQLAVMASGEADLARELPGVIDAARNGMKVIDVNKLRS